jgi:hypothetical protein
VLDAHPFFARTLRKGWVMGFIDAPWDKAYRSVFKWFDVVPK